MTVQPRPCDIPNSVGCTRRLQLFSGARRYIRMVLWARAFGDPRGGSSVFGEHQNSPPRRARDAVAVGPSEVKATVGASYQEGRAAERTSVPAIRQRVARSTSDLDGRTRHRIARAPIKIRRSSGHHSANARDTGLSCGCRKDRAFSIRKRFSVGPPSAGPGPGAEHGRPREAPR